MKIRMLMGMCPGDEEDSGRDPEPTVAGAINESIWEIIGEDEWAEICKKWKDSQVLAPEAYDWREVVFDVPAPDPSWFKAPHIMVNKSGAVQP